MKFTFKLISQPGQITCCQHILMDVFHEELGLHGMKIPDSYAPHSIYVGIISPDDVTIGTYRIVLPNPVIGLPIEETGFKLHQFSDKYHHSEPINIQQICEMSRLAILKEFRGRVSFRQIIHSACQIAQQYNNSLMLAALLPQNVRLFQRHGFCPVGQPLQDLSVVSNSETETEEAGVIVPMKIPLQRTSKSSNFTQPVKSLVHSI